MIDRTRLAISGAVLAIVAFAANAVIAWTDYQRDLDLSKSYDVEWVVPNYWEYLVRGTGLALDFLMAVGVVMLVVAWTMRPAGNGANDAIFRPPS